MREVLLYTDEYLDICSSLRSCIHLIRETEKSPEVWKWVFITLHAAIQGGMVVVLTRTDGGGSLKIENEREWYEYHYNNGPLPTKPVKIDSFLDLYKKIKKKGNLQYSEEERFVPKGNQGKSIKRLNLMRDDFIHFAPRSWTIHLEGVREVGLDCLEVLEFLVRNSGKFVTYPDYKENQIEDLIDKLKEEFGKIEFKV